MWLPILISAGILAFCVLITLAADKHGDKGHAEDEALMASLLLDEELD